MHTSTVTKHARYSFFGLFPMLLVVIPTIPSVPLAHGSSPYDSGYNHGCDDAGLSASDRYINEEGKGPSFHTDEFMSGYNDGFQSCGGSSSGGDDSDSGSDDSGSRSDVIRDFCSALNRGDYVAAEGILAYFSYGSVSLAARALCGITQLGE